MTLLSSIEARAQLRRWFTARVLQYRDWPHTGLWMTLRVPEDVRRRLLEVMRRHHCESYRQTVRLAVCIGLEVLEQLPAVPATEEVAVPPSKKTIDASEG